MIMKIATIDEQMCVFAVGEDYTCIIAKMKLLSSCSTLLRSKVLL